MSHRFYNRSPARPGPRRSKMTGCGRNKGELEVLFIDPSLMFVSHQATGGCLFRSHGSRQRQNTPRSQRLADEPPSSETSLAASSNQRLILSQLMSCITYRKIWLAFAWLIWLDFKTNTSQRQHDCVITSITAAKPTTRKSSDKELLLANLGVSTIASTCMNMRRLTRPRSPPGFQQGSI